MLYRLGMCAAVTFALAGCGMTPPPSCDGTDRTAMNAGRWDGMMSLGCPSGLFGTEEVSYVSEGARIIGMPGMSTMVELAEGETIQGIAIAPGSEWQVKPVKNALFVAASAKATRTMMHLQTVSAAGVKRSYHIELALAQPSERKTAVLKFTYPVGT